MRWSTNTTAAIELLADTAQLDVDLSSWCTYRAGGPAAAFVEANSEIELAKVAEIVAHTSVRTLVLGKGSNLLVSDAGFDGVAIRLGDKFASLAVEGPILEAGGAALLPVAARFSARESLSGFEWAVGVPGTIGGAVRMNAGGHGSDIAGSLLDATILDLATGHTSCRTSKDLGFGYRESNIGDDEVVVRARFELARGERVESEAVLSQIVKWRRANQPGGHNAGSVFANPGEDSAGRLIDAAGLKGFRIGTACVSTKHANFIQVDEGGSAQDVYALIRHLQHQIAETTGIRLLPENRLIGFETGSEPQPQSHNQAAHQ